VPPPGHPPGWQGNAGRKWNVAATPPDPTARAAARACPIFFGDPAVRCAPCPLGLFWRKPFHTGPLKRACRPAIFPAKEISVIIISLVIPNNQIITRRPTKLNPFGCPSSFNFCTLFIIMTPAKRPFPTPKKLQQDQERGETPRVKKIPEPAKRTRLRIFSEAAKISPPPKDFLFRGCPEPVCRSTGWGCC